MTKIIFQDFPGPENFTKIPRLPRRRGNPVIYTTISEENQPYALK